ncbi:putative LRR receptor-like serine/threonine-protein kinase [Citrus sinensis]|uniref:LRR receptor-like serine/threonine-protein kinase n=1 Tax=Citrus sinensis TaxID=2711 RepID=A0ACB8IPZ9_CITSI|nr:putative LRR receptor-like serine/threonine-protein kinase [Citrus sinensis]
MDERYAGHRVVLISKTVFLVILFLLCQLGSEFKFQSAAENDTKVGDLPGHEVAGLTEMMSSLQWRAQLPKLSSYCRETPKLSSNITITCLVDKGTPHISGIIMESVGLTGKIPERVAALTYLQILDLSDNTIHGSIPYQIGYLVQLITLDLSKNQLTGTIPTSLGNLRNLEMLDLSQNLLTGKIPPSLGRLSSLQTLSVPENGLRGTLPPELGKLSNLEELWLTSNNLRGDLPKDYENLKNLTILEIAGNYLSGPIPRFIAKWDNLYSLHVSDLQTMGFSFPKSANLSSISSLTLRNCSITGSIPPYIANWNQLGYLDLSFNNLAGGIPNTLKKLFLSELYLTGNMLNGTLPDWIYSNVRDKGDLAYNEFIFPEPETHKTFPEEIVRKYCPDGQKKSQYNDNLHINAGGDKHHREGFWYEADKSTSNFYVNEPAHNWAYSCNGHFYGGSMADSRAFIQKVTCGASVIDASLYDEARLCPNSLKYYGFCLRNGNYTVSLLFSEIVFAKNDDYSSSAKRVFDIYIQVDFGVSRSRLSKIGIVAIVLGAVLALILFLALMWRLGWIGDRELRDANSSTRLDWPARVRICHGIAKGLKYLHEDNPSRKIVHRNIKPSNILLDGNLNAKVSDLGLAKLYDEENPYKFIQEKGTVVYMAPEYAMRKAITEKVDVFSFGIVLLEIISGQTNAKYEANQETEFLLDTAIVLHSKGRLSELVDKQMPNEHAVMKQAKIILELAMRCVDQSPTLRPTMSEAVSALERISN